MGHGKGRAGRGHGEGRAGRASVRGGGVGTGRARSPGRLARRRFAGASSRGVLGAGAAAGPRRWRPPSGARGLPSPPPLCALPSGRPVAPSSAPAVPVPLCCPSPPLAPAPRRPAFTAPLAMPPAFTAPLAMPPAFTAPPALALLPAEPGTPRGDAMGARLGLCALRAHLAGWGLAPLRPLLGVWGSGALPPPAPFGWSASRGRRLPASRGRALRSRFPGWGFAPLRPLPSALPPLLFVRSVGVALVAVHPVPVVAVVSSLFRGAGP